MEWGIILLVALVALPMAYDYAIDRLSPVSRWVHYEKVAPINEVNLLGEPLYMRSHRKVNHAPLQVEFNDNLRCNINGADTGISSTKWPRTYSAAHDWLENGIVWQYSGAQPSVPAECYMMSSITVILPLARRVVEIKSEPFRFIASAGGGR